jgi:hypothetical protein
MASEAAFAGKMGTGDASTIGQWAAAMQFEPGSVFAGSGSARNSQGQQVSALDEIQAAYQAAGVAAAAAAKTTSTATTATTSHTTATAALTTATNAATTSTSNLNTSIRNLATTSSSTSSSVSTLGDTVTTTQPAIDFASMSSTNLASAITSMSQQLFAAGAIVEQGTLSQVDYANELQNTIDSMNAGAKASSQLSSAASSAASSIAAAAQTIAAAGQAISSSATSGTGPAGGIIGPDGKTYADSNALYAAIQANPNILAHQSQGQQISFVGPQGGNSTSYNTSQAQYEDFLPDAGGFSMANALGNSNIGTPFGQSGLLSNQTTKPQINVTINNPVVTNTQMAQSMAQQVVTQLRTVTGLKL